MSWMDEARAVIKRYDDQTPPGAVSLEDRKRHLRQICPAHFRSTSWGRKVWPKACKEYLKRFEPIAKSDASIQTDHLSPLERMMRRASA